MGKKGDDETLDMKDMVEIYKDFRVERVGKEFFDQDLKDAVRNLRFQVYPNEYEFVRQAAAAEGLPMTQFCRQAALQAAARRMEGQLAR